MEKMTRLERAKQFAPFAALRGYYDQIRKQEFIKSEYRERTEEELKNLNLVIMQVKKGDMLKVKYFYEDGFGIITGILSELNMQLKYLKIIKTKIPYNMVFEIEKI